MEQFGEIPFNLRHISNQNTSEVYLGQNCASTFEENLCHQPHEFKLPV